MRWCPSTSSRIGAARAIAALVVLLVPLAAGAQRNPPAPDPALRFARLIEDYRTKPIDPVLDDLASFVQEPQADTAVRNWLQRRRAREEEREDLQTALMLYSEGVIAVWAANDPYPVGKADRYLPALTRLRARLDAVDSRSEFLRGWYLLWESFRQAFVNVPPPSSVDFLDEALRAFPDDPEILLAAGTRSELTWWTADWNRHRDPRGSSTPADSHLVKARDYFRHGLARRPEAFELRLRLMRVLLALNDPEAASNLELGSTWTSTDPTLVYLTWLFEGALRERQRDYAAAARAYDRAIAQSREPQSARIARAHLEHATSSRAQAAALAIEAMSSASDDNDPWWVFNRGLVWHFDEYIGRQRSMVRAGAVQ